MPDTLPNSPYLDRPRRSEAAAKAQKIAALKRKFFRLMDRHRELKYGAPASCSDAVIREQIAAQNAVLKEAAAIATQIDDLLGEQWDWLAEEATRGEAPAEESNVIPLDADHIKAWGG